MKKLTIDEVIVREKRIHEENQKVVDTHVLHEEFTLEELYCDDTEVIEEHLSNYKFASEYHKQLAGWLEELKSYKDAEEQGLLLLLPCKVGDTVYAIPSWANFRLNKSFGHAEHNRVYPQIVDHIEFNSYGYWVSTCDGRQGHGQEAFGETWFLTREEAEAKLAEMQKGGAE